MRQQKLKWVDQEQIEELILNEKTGFLGLSTEDIPYVVPLNYVWYKEAIYFHGAEEGKKMDIIRVNKNACFTVCRELGTMTNPIPAKTDTAYKSVMVFGDLQIVEDLSEAHAAMQAILNKYVPGYYHTPLSKTHVEKYQSSLGSKTSVIKIIAKEITAKENHYDEAVSFYPGRSINMDIGN
ncbi:uncharacterized protein ACUXCC_004201 [Cytobacillus horneckiae]|uniref:pyridoxamine 5'-phosphate oxidase family protein n=1 Tax=Cytobacillus horneckiae TaxID=549687 RepID=UPI0019D241F3|nr:pyridoxamine 5'-phosphate oxidase family protein [Cytobacillus horneckiae]MBN6886907.1 pyridoxamine 5'-phosphate oxidase family protein [Cytobacillus horneckiae]MCM3177623.1 pyridoxamine 5'-phosphate oxidase family protein [Cytobacillus horneckiae]